MAEANQPTEGTVKLIKAGSAIAGSVAGTVAGFLAGGPGGAVLGAALGPLITELGSEIASRFLAPRETERIGAAMALAVYRIKEKLDSGEKPRTDGFFEKEPDGRSAAEEVYEGVLIAAQREHQEKKLPFFANLMANLAFHPEIDRAYASFLVHLGEELSYRQLCLLTLFALKDKSMLRQQDYRSVESFGPSLTGVLYEAADLDRRGLVSCGAVVFGPTDVKPGKMGVQGAGATLFELMELHRIPRQDVEDVASLLK